MLGRPLCHSRCGTSFAPEFHHESTKRTKTGKGQWEGRKAHLTPLLPFSWFRPFRAFVTNGGRYARWTPWRQRLLALLGFLRLVLGDVLGRALVELAAAA